MANLPPGMKPMLRKVVSDGGDELLQFYAEREQRLLGAARAVAQSHETNLANVPEYSDERVSERTDELTDGLFALVEGDFSEFFADLYVASAADADAKTPDRATAYADLTPDEWREQKTKWADGWREQGLEGTDDELATAHITTQFGIPKQAFYDVVVDWSDDAHGRKLEYFFGGYPYDPDRDVYPIVGLTTAETAIRWVVE